MTENLQKVETKKRARPARKSPSRFFVAAAMSLCVATTGAALVYAKICRDQLNLMEGDFNIVTRTLVDQETIYGLRGEKAWGDLLKERLAKRDEAMVTGEVAHLEMVNLKNFYGTLAACVGPDGSVQDVSVPYGVPMRDMKSYVCGDVIVMLPDPKSEIKARGALSNLARMKKRLLSSTTSPR